SVPTQNKRRVQTRISRQLHIAIAIANHPTRRQVYLKIIPSPIDQTGFWFAAVAVEPVRRLANRGMVCAVVDAVELGVLEILSELIVNADDYILGKITARNACLVRDHYRKPVVVIQYPDRLGGIRKQPKPGRMIDVANLLRNRSIAIDEDCWTLHCLRD